MKNIKLSSRDENWTQMPAAQPNWEPLESLYDNNEKILSSFMFMGSVKIITNDVIYLYKNKDTRKYINIDDKGITYRFDGKDYKMIPGSLAKVEVNG